MLTIWTEEKFKEKFGHNDKYNWRKEVKPEIYFDFIKTKINIQDFNFNRDGNCRIDSNDEQNVYFEQSYLIEWINENFIFNEKQNKIISIKQNKMLELKKYDKNLKVEDFVKTIGKVKEE